MWYLRKGQNLCDEFLGIVPYEVQTNLHTSALRTRVRPYSVSVWVFHQVCQYNRHSRRRQIVYHRKCPMLGIEF